jgi:hypothetical protein
LSPSRADTGIVVTSVRPSDVANPAKSLEIAVSSASS